MNYYKVAFLGVLFFGMTGSAPPEGESASGIGELVGKILDPCVRDNPVCDDHNVCTPDFCSLRGSPTRPVYADCNHGNARDQEIYRNRIMPKALVLNGCQKLICDPSKGYQVVPTNPPEQCREFKANPYAYTVCDTIIKPYGTPCDTSTPCSRKICQEGQCVASPPSLNATIQVETRKWPGTPVPCTSIPAIEIFNSLPAGGKGYGISKPTTLYDFANRTLISGGSTTNLAYYIKLTIDVEVGHAGKWGFRVGPDFLFGGMIRVDGVELVSRWKPMYWKGNFTDPNQSLTGSKSLKVGSHVVEVYGFSTGGDRQATMQVTAPGISTVWATVTNAKVSACK